MMVGSHSKFWMFLGGRADFILTDVPGSIPSHELCPFKLVNQTGQPNICANDVGIATTFVSNFLWNCLHLLRRLDHFFTVAVLLLQKWT